MIAVHDFAGRAVAVFGLAERGLAAAAALREGGARPLVWDDRADARARASEAGFEVVDLRTRDWGDVAALVVTDARASAAERRVTELAELTRTPVLGDVELFARALAARPQSERGRVVAVAGAHGKSTVVSLIERVLTASGRDAHVCGREDASPLALPAPHAGAIHVLELHARDLARAPSLRPDVALRLNADEPRGRGEDADAEPQLFAALAGDAHAVVGVDDGPGRALATELRTRERAPVVTPISAARALGRGVHAAGGVLFDAIDGSAREVLDLRRTRALLGRPHWQNAAAAYAACRRLGLEPAAIARGIADFPGLPHRIELVATRGRVRIVNDSYASDPQTTRHALAAFESVFWIVGGRFRRPGFAGLAPVMPRVAKAYVIGEASETIAAELKGRVVAEICRDLRTAVSHAVADARRSTRADPVVLLSPACSAEDQFTDAAARGEAFRSFVEGLPGAEMPGEAA